MFSPERKFAKMTCPSCEHRFSSKGNLRQHFVYFPKHRLVVEPFLSYKEAVANFLDGDMSLYHRKARLCGLFTKLSNEEMVELALPCLAKFLSLSGFLYEKCRKKSSEIKKESVKGSSVLYCKMYVELLPLFLVGSQSRSVRQLQSYFTLALPWTCFPSFRHRIVGLHNLWTIAATTGCH